MGKQYVVGDEGGVSSPPLLIVASLIACNTRHYKNEALFQTAYKTPF